MNKQGKTFTEVSEYEDYEKIGEFICKEIMHRLKCDNYEKAAKQIRLHPTVMESRWGLETAGVQINFYHFSLRRMDHKPIVRRFLFKNEIDLTSPMMNRKIISIIEEAKKDWLLHEKERKEEQSREIRKKKIEDNLKRWEEESESFMKEHNLNGKQFSISYNFNSLNISGLNKEKVIKLIEFYKQLA